MRISKKGIDLIKEFESFRSHPYICPAGVPTIGYGTTKGVTMNDDPISEARAEILLLNDLSIFEKAISMQTRNAKLNQNQFDALVCFVYNVGISAFKKSSLLKKVLNNPNDKNISLEFMKWVNGGGRKLPGLVRRREAESNLYFSC